MTEDTKLKILDSSIKKRRRRFLAVLMAVLLVLCATPLSDCGTAKAAVAEGKTMTEVLLTKGYNGMPSDVYHKGKTIIYKYYIYDDSGNPIAWVPDPVVVNYYTITWKQDDGTKIDTTTVREGNTPTHSNPKKAKTAEYTYTFAGWTPAISRAYSNATYTATYTATKNKYTVTWKDDEGNTLDTEQLEYGTIPQHEDAEKENTAEFTYTFTGWDPEPAAVTGDVTYTACFDSEKNKYKVSFVDEDGVTPLLDTAEYDYGTAPEDIAKPETPTKDKTAQYSYEFAGWSPEIKEVTEDTVYKATYSDSINKYSVTFVDEDGTTVIKEAKEYEYGTPAELIEKPEDPEKAEDEGYTYSFDKWNPDITEVIADAIYKAVYSAVKKQYAVTFMQADGVTVLSEELYDYGTAAADIKIPDIPKSYTDDDYIYNFTGWNPKLEVVSKDTVYTPVYEKSDKPKETTTEETTTEETTEEATTTEEVTTEEATTETTTTEEVTTEAPTTEAATTEAPGKAVNVDTVKTGDDSATMLRICFILMLLSALSMVGLLAASYGRGKKDK